MFSEQLNYLHHVHRLHSQMRPVPLPTADLAHALCALADNGLRRVGCVKHVLTPRFCGAVWMGASDLRCKLDAVLGLGFFRNFVRLSN
jgi:hypothetical protein